METSAEFVSALITTVTILVTLGVFIVAFVVGSIMLDA